MAKLRNLLLLLESTPSGEVAREIACRVARQCHAGVTGLAIQEKYSPASPREFLTEAIAERETRTSSEPKTQNGSNGTVLSATSETLSNFNIPYTEKHLTGPKYTLLSRESEVSDLTVMGREGNFEEEKPYEVKEAINLLLEYRPRPLIIAPPQLPNDGDILITYDGSAGASRAVQILVLMGLVDHQRIHVLSIDRRRHTAEAHARQIERYLNGHHVEPVLHVIDGRTSPAEIIFDKVAELRPSLLVAGAYGSSGWRRQMFGSVSDHLIRHSPVPLFSCQ